MPCNGQGDPEAAGLCAMIAYSRPGLREYSDVAGYHRIGQLTPVVEATVVPVGTQIASNTYLDRGGVELVEGEPWRGFPTSAALWRSADPSTEGENASPVITFSRSSAFDWSAGTAAGFAFSPDLEDRPTYPRWLAEQLDVQWMFQAEYTDIQVPFLRIASDSTGRFAGVWSSLAEIEGSPVRYEWRLTFSLLSSELRPLAGGVLLDEAGGATGPDEDSEETPRGLDLTDVDRSFIGSDPRFLAAEHLGAAVGALGEGRFVAAWLHPTWAETARPDDGLRPLDSLSFHAAEVVCDVVNASEP